MFEGESVRTVARRCAYVCSGMFPLDTHSPPHTHLHTAVIQTEIGNDAGIKTHTLHTP